MNRRTSKLLVHCFSYIQFYSKCVSDMREFFELPHDKCLDGSFGAPSKETIDSLQMIGEVLRDNITELPFFAV